MLGGVSASPPVNHGKKKKKGKMRNSLERRGGRKKKGSRNRPAKGGEREDKGVDSLGKRGRLYFYPLSGGKRKCCSAPASRKEKKDLLSLSSSQEEEERERVKRIATFTGDQSYLRVLERSSDFMKVGGGGISYRREENKAETIKKERGKPSFTLSQKKKNDPRRSQEKEKTRILLLPGEKKGKKGAAVSRAQRGERALQMLGKKKKEKTPA